jgi:hypothetical protein
MKRPVLMIVQGGATVASPWLDFPATIGAPSPFDKTCLCSFRIGREDTLKAARAGRRQPAFQLWSVVIGKAPPVPNVTWHKNFPSDAGLTRLGEAHACFKGLQRPLAEDDDGSSVLAYILKPRFYYAFDSGYDGAMVCVARKLVAADDLVFAAYIRLDEPCGGAGISPKGVLTHWGFVEADANDPELPVNYRSRYEKRLW